MNNNNVLTREDKKGLEAKLFALQKKRKKLVIRLDEARREGDLAENSAYHEIKNQLVILDNQVEEIEERLRVSLVVNKTNGRSQVGLGSRVVLAQRGGKREVKLVSAGMGNPLKGEVSADSPLGQALINKKKGAVVSVETPKGKMEYKIAGIG